jgi:hypothetical protein
MRWPRFVPPSPPSTTPKRFRSRPRGQVAEHAREADRYDALGQAEAAERLRRQASTLTAYLR